MSNHEEFSSDEQAFLESIMEPPGIDIQKERLVVVMDQFRQEWHNAGILTVFIDHMPDPTILSENDDVHTSIQLYAFRRAMDDSSHEQQELGLAAYVSNGRQTARIFDLPLVTRLYDVAEDAATSQPFSRYLDEQQAFLLTEQFEELHDLRRDGILPNLQPGTCMLFDPTTALRIRPESPEQ